MRRVRVRCVRMMRMMGVVWVMRMMWMVTVRHVRMVWVVWVMRVVWVVLMVCSAASLCTRALEARGEQQKQRIADVACPARRRHNVSNGEDGGDDRACGRAYSGCNAVDAKHV